MLSIKNGNNVDPFPLDFNDFITEGLAIFDYDNKWETQICSLVLLKE